jgi:hypothetical protein
VTPADDKSLVVRFNPLGDVQMFKKAMIAALAALSIGGAMTATSADAAPWHGGGRGDHDGWRGGWHEEWRGGWGRGGYGWRAPAYYVGPSWGYYEGCGWRWSPRWGRYVRACW